MANVWTHGVWTVEPGHGDEGFEPRTLDEVSGVG
jgi:hypothetical protein